jgi:hypothetical protein
MEVRISFDDTDPPVGQLWREAPGASGRGTTCSTRFSGWLGLLRALSDALDDQGDIPHEQ